MNKNCIFGLCFDNIDHNKKRQHFVYDYDVAKHQVYLRTRLHERLNFYVIYIMIALKNGLLDFSFVAPLVFMNL